MLIDNEDKVDIRGPHPLTTETKHHQAAPNLRVTGNDVLLSNKLRPLCLCSTEQAHRNRTTQRRFTSEKWPPVPIKQGRGRARGPSGLLENKKYLTEVGKETSGRPASRLVTMPTELPSLQFNRIRHIFNHFPTSVRPCACVDLRSVYINWLTTLWTLCSVEG